MRMTMNQMTQAVHIRAGVRSLECICGTRIFCLRIAPTMIGMRHVSHPDSSIPMCNSLNGLFPPNPRGPSAPPV